MVSYHLEIREYVTDRGTSPFRKWYRGLSGPLKTRVDARLQRIKILGSFGDCKSLRGGLYELRFITHSGPRIYFAKDGNGIVLLLTGGDKSSQRGDIEKARIYWKDYKIRRD